MPARKSPDLGALQSQLTSAQDQEAHAEAIAAQAQGHLERCRAARALALSALRDAYRKLVG